jgi:hypothetical protein
MNIIVAGIMGRYPYGGVAWCSLMYLLGLRALGHRVWYLEDMAECNYDPVEETLATDPRYALEFIHACLAPYDLGDRWCYVDYLGEQYYGHSRQDWLAVCAGADLFLNLSGGAWRWRDEYARIPRSAFIDSDPAFTQLEIARRGPERIEHFAQFDALFTFGSNIGRPECPVPVAPLTWHPTWQPVSLDEWPAACATPRGGFTTVMSWQIDSFPSIGGNKGEEFGRILDLPRRVAEPLELAIAVPNESDVWARLEAHGWRCRDAYSVSSNLDDYRAYIRSSLGEFSVAKKTYVATHSGWFSDRTECYLASGRPAVVQDTGFSAHLPTGEGLFAFRDADEAQAGIEAVLADYPRHARVAREIAAAHFAADVVLPALLDRVLAGDRQGRR